MVDTPSIVSQRQELSVVLQRATSLAASSQSLGRLAAALLEKE